jgi:Ca-activated chloride channel family protein
MKTTSYLPALCASSILALTACAPQLEDSGSEGVAEPLAHAEARAEVEAAPAPAPSPRQPTLTGRREQIAASVAREPGDKLCLNGQKSTEAAEFDPKIASEQGRLAVRSGDRWLAMPLERTRFDTLVVGTIAETTVTQKFHNPFDQPIEALYTFPLAADGAVDGYAITVGSRTIRGEMKARAEAQKLYEEAKNDGRTAALLEQERANIFTQSLANIAPGESIEVTLHVVQPLRQERGTFELALPTVVGPRYAPADRVADAKKINPPQIPDGFVPCADLELSVAIEAGMPIQGISAKYHTIAVERQEGGALIELARAGELLNRDFVLTWGLAGPEPRASLLTQKGADGGAFTLTIMPPTVISADKIRPRELVFVIDSSGSMMGEPIDTAKEAVRRALDGMQPQDTFQILNFADRASQLGPVGLANTAENRERGLRYLDQVASGGGTEMLSGIRAALDMPGQPERMRMVLFLTDGYIGDEAQIFRAIDERIGNANARLFSLGVGGGVNRYLLDGMATAGRGAVTYMGPGESPKAVVDRFYQQIDRPVLTDIEIDWGGLSVEEVLPARIPDLFAGQPVVVFGRFKGAPSGTIKLKGQIGGEPVEIPVDVDFAGAETHTGLTSMWARKKVDALLSYPVRPYDVPEAVQKDVIALATRYKIMTEYTAFIAVDERRVVDPDGTIKTVSVPVEVPMGTVRQDSYGLGTLGLIGYGHGGGGTGVGYGRGAGAGFGGRGTRVPTVRQAKAEITGSLDKDIIRRIVRAHINEVRHCYNQGLAADPNLKGRVVIKFVIDAQGKVISAQVDENLTDVSVGECISKAVTRWIFPKPSGGTITVTYPFILEPG